jgi:hypothetical protein
MNEKGAIVDRLSSRQPRLASAGDESLDKLQKRLHGTGRHMPGRVHLLDRGGARACVKRMADAAKVAIKQIVRSLNELNNGMSLEELLRTNQAWVSWLGVLQTEPNQATVPDLMWLVGTPIAAWPAIQNAAGREHMHATNLVAMLVGVLQQSAATHVPPSTILGQRLAAARAHRATFHMPTRRAPPQDATPQPVPPPPCTHPYIHNYDVRRPQIQQYEDAILRRGEPGPAKGVPVTLESAPSLASNVKDALRYVGVYHSWAHAFGVRPENLIQPAIQQAITLAANGGLQPIVPGYTPFYVLDGANIFNRNRARWDAQNRCNAQFVNAASRPGPVIIVMQHHVLVEDILSMKSGVRTDENLKHLDFFLCQLHGWQFPVVILEIQPEQCQDTMQLPDGQGGEFPCLYNDRNKEWLKRPDGTDYLPGEPGFNTTRQKANSYCSVWEEEEDKTRDDPPMASASQRSLLHDFCEFDDAIVDRLVERVNVESGTNMAYRVSGDANPTTPNARTRIWKEMSKLGDRLCVRLYLLVQRPPEGGAPVPQSRGLM